jgi:outer membrane lipoprotein-sorting protein
MMKKYFILATAAMLTLQIQGQDPDDILKRVERNMSSENRVFESTMTINGAHRSRTITSRTYAEGYSKSFTEYLTPAREQGTKMLKLGNQLWIYSPSTDRIIQISGHMLRQSVMGSDLSYEDMMDDRKLTELYTATLGGDEVIGGRKTWILDLTAKVSDVSYHSMKMWVDTERYVPLKEELFGSSGQLLKRTTFEEVEQIAGRWFPMKLTYKDVLKSGDGTEFTITSVRFDQKIPDYIFTKAALKQ